MSRGTSIVHSSCIHTCDLDKYRAVISPPTICPTSSSVSFLETNVLHRVLRCGYHNIVQVPMGNISHNPLAISSAARRLDSAPVNLQTFFQRYTFPRFAARRGYQNCRDITEETPQPNVRVGDVKKPDTRRNKPLNARYGAPTRFSSRADSVNCNDDTAARNVRLRGA